MLELEPYDTKLQRILKNYFNIALNSHGFTVWSICPLERLLSLLNITEQREYCRSEWFPFIFWAVVIRAILGVFYSGLDLINMISKMNKGQIFQPNRHHNYLLIYNLLRKSRLIVAFMVLSSWILLLYSLLSVSPNYMIPWIYFNGIMLSLQILIYAIQIRNGQATLSLRPLTTFILTYFMLTFTHCIKNVFQVAIYQNNIDDLRAFDILF